MMRSRRSVIAGEFEVRSTLHECLSNIVNRPEILVGQADNPRLEKPDRLLFFPGCESLIIGGPIDPAQKVAYPGALGVTGIMRNRSSEEPFQISDAVGAELEQRLIVQMLQRILAPDIDYDCQPGLDIRDVRVILVRADANVDASAHTETP